MIDGNNIELADKLDQEIDKWVKESKNQFNLIKKPNRPTKIALQAFANVGFVSNIALHYLMETFSYERIAGFFSDIIPSFINYYQKELFFPVSIVELELTNQESILLTVGEVPISGYALFTITDALYDIYQKLGVEQVIHLDSFISSDTNASTPISYVFGSDTNLVTKMQQATDNKELDSEENIKHIFGLGASCRIIFRSIDVCSVLIGTESEQPNEVAAYQALKILDQIFDLSIKGEIISDIAEIYERKSEQIFGIQRDHEVMQKDRQYSTDRFQNEYY